VDVLVTSFIVCIRRFACAWSLPHRLRRVRNAQACLAPFCALR
jgi:hypothetical protein